MSTFTSDVRYAIRSFRKTPGFTSVAVITLALGIGANTAIFSVVDKVLLRPAPFEHMNGLAMAWETDRNSGTSHEPASVPDYQDYQQRSRTLQQIAAFLPTEVNLTPAQGDPSRVPTLAVSHEFFPLVGMQPVVGRTFNQQEDRPGGPAVAVIGEQLWRDRYRADRAIVGKTIRLGGVPTEVIGVMPAQADFGTLQVLAAADYGRGFADRGGRIRVDIWVPLAADPVNLPRSTHPVFMLGRLAPGATIDQAQREMEGIATDLERTYPENAGRGIHVESLSQVVFAPVKPTLLVLLGAVALVLLIACANVANLLLARGTARAREVTVRAALGAGMGRLAIQFFIESGLLALTGAILGTLLAFGGLRILLAMAPGGIPRAGTIGIDFQVLLVTLGITALVGVVFGLLPILQARGQLPGRSTSASREHIRFRSALVVSELALTVMLMVGAGLLIKSLYRLQQVNPGFQSSGVLKAEYELPASRYPRDFSKWPNWPEVQRFHRELVQRVTALPGVEAVSVAGAHPLEAGNTSSISVVGREAEAGDWPEPGIRFVDSKYFETMQVSLVDGRGFALSDDAQAPTVIVINQAANRVFFGAGRALGQQIRLWGSMRTVIGIVGDERIHGLDNPTPPAVYLPSTQVPFTNASLLVRVNGNPTDLVPAVRSIVRELDPALPLFGVEPLAVTVANSLGQRRFSMVVLGVFALVGIVLAMVGVHGVLSYSVAQRTREIGIRMAVGANATNVRSLVVRHGARLAGLGLILGLLGALAVTRLLSALLYGVQPNDLFTFAAVAMVLGVVAILASWLPARRAVRVDPIVALRTE